MKGRREERNRLGEIFLKEKRDVGFGEHLKTLREKADRVWIGIRYFSEQEDEGIDGILVTVGLCIIALLLCVVMKNSLTDFIKSIVSSMTKEATDILSGTRV